VTLRRTQRHCCAAAQQRLSSGWAAQPSGRRSSLGGKRRSAKCKAQRHDSAAGARYVSDSLFAAEFARPGGILPFAGNGLWSAAHSPSLHWKMRSGQRWRFSPCSITNLCSLRKPASTRLPNLHPAFRGVQNSSLKRVVDRSRAPAAVYSDPSCYRPRGRAAALRALRANSCRTSGASLVPRCELGRWRL